MNDQMIINELCYRYRNAFPGRGEPEWGATTIDPPDELGLRLVHLRTADGKELGLASYDGDGKSELLKRPADKCDWEDGK